MFADDTTLYDADMDLNLLSIRSVNNKVVEASVKVVNYFRLLAVTLDN
jgi:hypothetical protein